MSKLRELAVTFFNAILAGIFIGMAGTVFLSVENRVTGAFLFGFGLLTILCYSFKLYTGAIGYLAVQGRNAWNYLVLLTMIWGGNFTGTNLVGWAVRHSRIAEGVAGRAAGLCRIKLADSWESWLILSFFCGILMYLAVESYRRKEEFAPVLRVAMVFLCVAIFILSGFEHCIANMFYFAASAMWSPESLTAILVMTLGNSLGGMMLPVADRLRGANR